jgi:hypothetical protein
MERTCLILFWSLIAVLNQANMQYCSNQLRGFRISSPTLVEVVLILRILSVAGLSLIMSAWCFRYFGMLEFAVAQTVFYFMLVLYVFVIQHQKVTSLEVIGLVVIGIGTGVFVYAR